MTSFSSPLEILHVSSKKVACGGGRENKNGALGHPLVYLDMDKNNFVVCPYCSKYFALQKASNANSKKS